ncbi:alanyl-tRNA synthetase [Candidatus Uzinura diaspidicola str. ASNER]|uniref:Alanine--tRNA ligase n=1 Tax=Candidatus Uzinura diaspidicola str. ASNER TaxID=1133592 RepID=L7VKH8_9FLAO|nr:alanyl-tRNA synthetase [Candidatus Uzinura diaspidicola str. ASNER]
MTSQEIRQHFLDYFSSKYHHILPSAPIIIKYDPSLMFVNAGMNPFKEYFIGKKKVIYTNIASIQKCLRVSGKHNDLEDVGKDSYHHTMFEMLGNWSFGYCIKRQTINWAWELLTAVYKIPIDNIYVTIFAGSNKEGISIDGGSQFFWENFLKKERIISCKKEHNFWEMSNLGPCGPCSEIHVDLRSHKEKKNKSGNELVNKGHPQVIELWNLVFMEFFRQFDGNLEELSERHVDTGIGFERLCRILQHKDSNYDTDIFSTLIRKVEELSNKIYGFNPYTDIAIRVVVDHIRAISFAIADGQNPSNAGAGYVIRRILRRAVSYGYRFLFQREAFLCQLIEILVKEMGIHFTELKIQNKLIKEKIFMEESFFFKTINKGLKRLENIIQETKVKKQKSIAGIKIFELFDTFGFPMDLSRLLATENALVIDEVGFKRELKLQRDRSRNASTFQTDDWTIIKETNSIEDFVVYDKLSLYVHLSKYRRVKKNRSIYYHIVFTTTPFYKETEQVGDKGVIENEKEKISIIDTKKENRIFLHIANSIPQSPEKAFQATVNKFRRKSIEKNHSATHLLHYAISIILNDVTKTDSYARQDSLRVDFLYPKKLTFHHIQNIEGVVQEMIYQDLPLKESISLPNSIDKDSEKVRSIRFGPIVELCRGLHIKSTREIGSFKIISEHYVGSGIRRIEAITSKFAIKFLNKTQESYQIIIEEMNRSSNPIKSIQIMRQDNKIYLSKIEALILKEIQRLKTAWVLKAKYHNHYILICEKTSLDVRGLKTIALALRIQNTEIIIIIGSVFDEFICVAISDKLIDIYGVSAFKILKKVSTMIHCENDNKGLSMTKVKTISKLTEALKLVHSWNETDFYL